MKLPDSIPWRGQDKFILSTKSQIFHRIIQFLRFICGFNRFIAQPSAANRIGSQTCNINFPLVWKFYRITFIIGHLTRIPRGRRFPAMVSAFRSPVSGLPTPSQPRLVRTASSLLLPRTRDSLILRVIFNGLENKSGFLTSAQKSFSNVSLLGGVQTPSMFNSTWDVELLWWFVN